MINCLIVEDEPLAARVIADYVKLMPELHLTGICEDVRSARIQMELEQVDLLLLDINLPSVNGIDFIRSLSAKCHVVLTTAYNKYAITGYELDVVDYLLKPISYERFSKAIDRVIERRKLPAPGQNDLPGAEDHFFVRSEGRMIKVLYDQILYIEAHLNYVVIHTQEKKLLIYSTLKKIEQSLPSARFVKVQKSFIVALGKVSGMRGSQLFIGSISIAVSRKLKDDVQELILRNGQQHRL